MKTGAGRGAANCGFLDCLLALHIAHVLVYVNQNENFRAALNFFQVFFAPCASLTAAPGGTLGRFENIFELFSDTVLPPLIPLRPGSPELEGEKQKNLKKVQNSHGTALTSKKDSKASSAHCRCPPFSCYTRGRTVPLTTALSL